MCKIAASSLEISQFSLSVNISTCRTEERRFVLFGKVNKYHLPISRIFFFFREQHFMSSWFSLVYVIKKHRPRTQVILLLIGFNRYLHRRADVGVFFQVVSAVAHCALTLQGKEICVFIFQIWVGFCFILASWFNCYVGTWVQKSETTLKMQIFNQNENKLVS